MIAPDGLPAVLVDRRQDVLVRLHLAAQPRLVGHQPRHGVDGVVHVGDARLGHDRAGVADLAAALGVERRAVQEDLHHPAGLGPGLELGLGLGLEHGHHPSRHLVVLEAPPDEGGRPLGVEQGSIRRLVTGAGVVFAAARARSRCSAMAASKPARSTSTPASRASSSVSSTGKPWVSCRVKATSPPSTFVPVANASSRRLNPARRVRSNPASSRATTLTMRSRCATSVRDTPRPARRRPPAPGSG